jgi:hypothetical protein
MSWASLYNKSVDTLFKRKLIDWHHKDERGAFYSTIIATNEGIKQYERNTGKTLLEREDLSKGTY